MRHLVLTLVLLALSAPALAERYLSTFGFSVEIPSHWSVMTRNELKDNPDMLNFDNEIFANTDRELVRQMIEMVRSGRIEVYFNQRTSTERFADNINVYRQPGRIPANNAELSQACRALPVQLSRAFGRSLNLHACELRKVAGLRSLYLDFDGVVEGTRSVQYQVDKGNGEAIVFTLTSRGDTLSTNNREFDDIVGSVILE